MSTVRESNPWWAMTSAENALGIDSHPFTTASPRAQIVLSVFSLTSPSSRSGAELGPADRAEVAPATNPKVLGLLEVGDGRDARRRALEVEDLRPMLDRPVLWRRLADFGEQRQAEEVPETGADVAAERLPRLGRQLDPVLVLEERRRFWIFAVATRLGGAPLAPHPRA